MKLSLPLLGAALLLSASNLFAQFKMPVQYSADQVVTAGGQQQKIKFSMDGEKVRAEMQAQGQEVISIVRKDKKLVYMVMPSQKMYMEMPLPEGKAGPVEDPFEAADLKIESLGKDTLRAIVCDKYQVTAQGKVGFIWVNAKDQFPVRYETEDKTMSIDWENFKTGSQPASLFEPPTDCKKMDLGGMGGAMMGQ